MAACGSCSARCFARDDAVLLGAEDVPRACRQKPRRPSRCPRPGGRSGRCAPARRAPRESDWPRPWWRRGAAPAVSHAGAGRRSEPAAPRSADRVVRAHRPACASSARPDRRSARNSPFWRSPRPERAHLGNEEARIDLRCRIVHGSALARNPLVARAVRSIIPTTTRPLPAAPRVWAQSLILPCACEAKPVVAQPEAMLADQLLVEVLGRESG